MNTKVDFKSVRAAVDKLKASQARESELAAEQGSVRAGVDKATASGRTNDAALLRKLGEDKTRLELYPAKIAEKQAETAAVVEELRSALHDAGVALTHAAGDTRTQTAERLTEFLGKFISEPHYVEEVVNEALRHTDAVILAESNANLVNYRTFGGGSITFLLTCATELFRMEQSQS